MKAINKILLMIILIGIMFLQVVLVSVLPLNENDSFKLCLIFGITDIPLFIFIGKKMIYERM